MFKEDMDPKTLTIQYFGAYWCSSCKKVYPQIVRLATRYGISILEHNYDLMEESEKSSITKLPTVRIIDGYQLHTEITTQYADMLEIWLRSHVRVNTSEDF